MGCPGSGPCQVWNLDLSCCLSPSGAFPDPCLLGSSTPVPQPIIDTAILAASQMLFSLTGRQFGCCDVLIRPCKTCLNECCISGDSGDFPYYPVHQADGTWTNVSCSCIDGCSSTPLSQIDLPYPVCSINEVLIDGVVVDPTTYRVDEFYKLVRLGADVWPTENNLTLPTTEVGTWSVDLTYGRPIPELVLMAASALACELVKGCSGQPCTLPQRLTSVTRQGVSLSFLDPQAFFTQGRTGIYLVDLAVMVHNPKLLQRRPTVHSPDVANKWRVAGTWKDGDVPGCISDVSELDDIDGGGPSDPNGPGVIDGGGP